MVDKLAQMKIQQMAFMIIALTVFFVLVGMAILVWQIGGIKETATELNEKNALLLVSRLAYSPEFSCGDVFDYGQATCVDGDKVMALSENKNVYTKNFWGVSNIEIRKILSDGETVCTMANYPNCDTIRILSGNVKGNYYSNFVILCRKDISTGETVDKCEMAKLMVAYDVTGK